MKNLFKLFIVYFIIGLIYTNGLAQTTLGIQDFETSPSTPTMTYSGSPTISTTRASSGTKAWNINGSGSGASESATFSNVSISGYGNVSFELKLSAYANGSGGAGAVDNDDNVIIELSTDGGTTWSSEVEIGGESNTDWPFTATTIATATYDGDNTPTSYFNFGAGSIGNSGKGTVKISIPNSNYTQVMARITATVNGNKESWAIDDVKVIGTAVVTTLAQVTNGIASSTLTGGATNKALIGFSLTSNITVTGNTFTAVTITNSSTPTGKLSNLLLYTSTDNDYSTSGDNTSLGSVSLSGNNFIVTGLSQSLTTSAKYYFIVATIEATVTASTAQFQSTVSTSNITIGIGSKTGSSFSGTNYSFTAPSSPTVTVSATNLNLGSSTVGTPGISQSFTVSGAALSANIIITAPTNFEIRTGVASYGTTVTLTPSSGSVSMTTIDARYNPAGPAGSVNTGNITVATTGATTQNIAVQGICLIAEPSTSASIPSFGVVTYNTIDVNITAGNGTKRLLVVKSGSAISGSPVDGTTYTASTTYGSGSTIATGEYVIMAGTSSTITVSNLPLNTTIYFAIFEYNDNGTSGTENYKTSSPGTAFTALDRAFVRINASGSFPGVSTDWSPTRTITATNDYLIFDGSTLANPTVSLASATTSVGALHFINNVRATFNITGNHTINIDNGDTGYDFSVTSGSTFIVTNSTSRALTLNVTSGETGLVGGTITFQGTGTAAHTLNATDASAITFSSGSTFNASTNFSGNPFGTANVNSIVFQSGSTYTDVVGSDPFGATQPNTVAVFQSGSLYKISANVTPASFSGRTMGILEFNDPLFSQSMTGTSSFTVDTIKVSNAAVSGVNINLTGGVNIKGNLAINSGSVSFNPGSAGSINFNGTGNQKIYGSSSNSVTFGANSTLNIASGSTLSLYKDLNFKGNWSNSGTFNAITSTVTFSGSTSTAKTITGSNTFYNMVMATTSTGGVTITSGAGNTQKISNILTLTSGTLTTNGNLTIASTSSYTGQIAGSGSGSISGTLVYERYISTAGWHYFSSPVSGTTLPTYNDINDDVTISTSNFYDYVEGWAGSSDNGWRAITSAGSTTLTSMKGYALKYPTAGVTLDMTGTYSHSTAATVSGLTWVSAGGTWNSSTESGWTLIGNPYPSYVDWDLVTVPSGINGTITYYDGANGREAYYNPVGSASVNGGNNFIPPMQAFWIQTNTNNQTLTIPISARVTTGTPSTTPSSTLKTYWRKANLKIDQAVLRLSSGSYEDETIVRFIDGASSGMDQELDACKMSNDYPVPSLSSITEGLKYAINSLSDSLLQNCTVPLSLEIAFPGTYSIKGLKLDKFDNAVNIFLVDKELNKIIDLREDTNYSFQMSVGTIENRFEIQFRSAIITSTENSINKENIEIYGSEQNINVKIFNTHEKLADIEVIDLLGRSIIRKENIDISSGMYTLSIPGIDSGIYMVKVSNGTSIASGKVFLQK